MCFTSDILVSYTSLSWQYQEHSNSPPNYPVTNPTSQCYLAAHLVGEVASSVAAAEVAVDEEVCQSLVTIRNEAQMLKLHTNKVGALSSHLTDLRLLC